MHNFEDKLDDLEGRSRRNNLIFNGIGQADDETQEQCENTLRETISKKLNIDTTDISFDRVHRLRSKVKPNPVIARFTFYKDSRRVLGARSKLRGSNIYINEDFTPRVRNIRKKLEPYLKKFRDEKKRVSMVFDHLFVDGERYDYDPALDTICKAARNSSRPSNNHETNSTRDSNNADS